MLRHVLAAIATGSVVIAALTIQSVPAAAKGTGPAKSVGAAAYDVSYPQCGVRLPSDGNLGIVGVTAGLPWSTNSCLAPEYAWAAAKSQPAHLYMNTANPETASSSWGARAGSGPRPCTAANLADPSNIDCAYNYGWNSATDALARATATVGAAASTRAWWLDVETGNSWNGTTTANAQDLQGSVDYLRGASVPAVGFYSTGYQWGVITGGYHPATAVAPAPADWLAGATSVRQATSWCSPTRSFSGGVVRLVQYPSGGFDGDVVCP
jgi:hypothetical protein